MPKLVKDASLQDHTWVALRSEEDIQSTNLNSGQWLVPAEQFKALKSDNPTAQLGLLASPATDVELLESLSNDVTVIAIDFPAFMDGRGFSQARALREYADFKGEIRAVGHFIEDQIFYLHRCGINSFEFNDNIDEDRIKSFLSTFTVRYQAGIDEPQPLFRRRA